MWRLLFWFLCCCRALAEAELTVYAAASLTEALTEAGAAFQQKDGTKVFFNFGASSILARQIQAGGRADLFISADEEKMDDLEMKGLIRESTRTNLLSNSLVIITAAEGPDLGGPEGFRKVRRIALAEPSAVPAGIYARKYLEAAGLWDDLQEKIVPTQNVRGAVAAVESGNVDAAIVYKTDAALLKSGKVAFEIPVELTPAIIYPAAVTSESPHPELAREFLRFLASPAAAPIWIRHGFKRIEPAAG